MALASLFCVIATVVASVAVKTMALYPFHASCKIDWLVIDGFY